MWSDSLPTIQQGMNIPVLAVGTFIVLVASFAFVQFAPSAAQPAMTYQAEATIPDEPSIATPSLIDSQESSLIAGDQTSVPVDTKVTINGQDVPVPPSGLVQKTVENANGNTSFNLSVDSNVTGDSTVQSSNSVTFNLQTTSEVTTDNTE